MDVKMELTKITNHCNFPVYIGPTAEVSKELGWRIDGKQHQWMGWIYKNVYVYNPTNTPVPMEVIQLNKRIVEIHIGKRPKEEENNMSTGFYIAEKEGDEWKAAGQSLFIVHAAGQGEINITWTQLPGAIVLAFLENAEARLTSEDPAALIDDYGKTYGMGDFYNLCRKAQHQIYEPAAIRD